MLLPALPESGVLRPWPAVLVTWGPGSESTRHAHHCWHLLLGLDGDLGVSAGAAPTRRAAAALLTGPDVPHAVDARCTRIVVVFVAPESAAGEQLRATHGARAVVGATGAQAERLRSLLSPAALVPGARLEDAVARALALGGAQVEPPPRSHPAVRRTLRWLAEAPAGADVSLEALARRSGLSPGRFMHVFTEGVGLPLRPYLLWLKLQRAGAALASGASLGSAAAATGFSDSAHMTRTFRRMFGVAPSRLQRGSQSVQDL